MTIEDIIRAIYELHIGAENFKITSKSGTKTKIITLCINKEYFGKAVGKQGKFINAIKTIISSIQVEPKVFIELYEK